MKSHSESTNTPGNKSDNGLATTRTEIVPASKLGQILGGIWVLQNPKEYTEHKRAEAAYAELRARSRR